MVWVLLVFFFFLASLLNSFWFSQENWGLFITEYTQLVWLVEEDTGQNFLGKKKRTIFRCRTPENEEWLGIYRLPRSAHPQTRTLRVSTRKDTAKIHKQKCNRFWNVDQLVQVTAEVGRSQNIEVFLVQKVTKEGRAEICISKLSLWNTLFCSGSPQSLALTIIGTPSYNSP